MDHPGKHVVEPGRVADYMGGDYDIWFEEMICTLQKKNGIQEVCLLSVCPATGNLMYMPNHWPIQWMIIADAYVEEAYLRYVIEKDMLNEDREEGT